MYKLKMNEHFMTMLVVNVIIKQQIILKSGNIFCININNKALKFPCNHCDYNLHKGVI